MKKAVVAMSLLCFVGSAIGFIEGKKKNKVIAISREAAKFLNWSVGEAFFVA
jgi:hypothetical protein